MAPRKVALVGTAATRVDAPVSDLSYEIWGVGSRDAHITRADRWFELHRLAGEPPDWAENWRSVIKKWSSDCEIVMMYPEMDLGPRVSPYPAARITARFGTYFMQSSFSWMMALAIDEMAPRGKFAESGSEIGLWGVDMEYGTEYKEQRMGFRHFISVAEHLGIAVTHFADSGLSFDPVPYPMIQDDPLLNKVTLRLTGTRERLETLERTQRSTKTLVDQNRGAIDALEALPSKGTVRDLRRLIAKRLPEIEAETDALLDSAKGVSRDLIKHEAALGEMEWLKDYLNP